MESPIYEPVLSIGNTSEFNLPLH